MSKAADIALSLVLCSRNDRYQGNSVWRLETALNYAAAKVFELGREDEVEIVVSDWGSKTPLRESIRLTPEAARLARFLTIDPDIARREQKDSPFPEVLALNAAVRRARGEYIGRIDQDTLVSRHFFETFFWLEEKQRLLVPLDSAIMISNRREIPYRFAVHCPPFPVVDRYVSTFGSFLPLTWKRPAHLFYEVFIGILMFHRDVWRACRGFDERFIYMDFMEIDLILRLSTRYQVINFGELVDYAFYHLGHGRPGVSRDVSRDDRKANPWHKIDDMPASFCPNGDDWGLERYELELQSAATAQSARGPRRLLHGATFVGLSFLSAALTLGDRSIAFARRAIRAVGRRSKRLALRVVQGVGLHVVWVVPEVAFALM